MVDEQVRQAEDHRVRVDIDVEIPRENWEWAVERAGLADPDAEADELPDPNDHQNQAIELVDARYHYSVSDGGDDGDDVQHAVEDDGFERESEGGDGSDETEREAIAPGVWITPESTLTDDEIGAIQRAVVSEDRRLASIPSAIDLSSSLASATSNSIFSSGFMRAAAASVSSRSHSARTWLMM
jgi:hypothetical protein